MIINLLGVDFLNVRLENHNSKIRGCTSVWKRSHSKPSKVAFWCCQIDQKYLYPSSCHSFECGIDDQVLLIRHMEREWEWQYMWDHHGYLRHHSELARITYLKYYGQAGPSLFFNILLIITFFVILTWEGKKGVPLAGQFSAGKNSFSIGS